MRTKKKAKKAKKSVKTTKKAQKTRKSVAATKEALGIKARPLLGMLVKGPYAGLTEIEARQALHAKILAVRNDCPEVETTGQVEMREGEQFCFTQYADVRRKLDPILDKHRLTFIPYSDRDHLTRVEYEAPWHYCTTHYVLTDIETGYQAIVPGFGVGRNAWWALDSAGTLALKHALLQALMVNWDNRAPYQAMLDEARSSVPMTVDAVLKELREFNWFRRATEEKEKEKQNANSTSKEHR